MRPQSDAHRMIRDDLAKAAAALGWPAVDPERIGASTIESPWGPGEEEWRGFLRWASTAQMRHVRSVIANSPGTFTERTSEAPKLARHSGRPSRAIIPMDARG